MRQHLNKNNVRNATNCKKLVTCELLTRSTFLELVNLTALKKTLFLTGSGKCVFGQHQLFCRWLLRIRWNRHIYAWMCLEIVMYKYEYMVWFMHKTGYNWIEVFQIDQLSSVSVHLQLNLIEHAVGRYVSSALLNTISILFICMEITAVATHHLCLYSWFAYWIATLYKRMLLPHKMHNWWRHMHMIQYWHTSWATNELKLNWPEQFEAALLRIYNLKSAL